MRTRISLCLLACCCAVLTACTAAAPNGPDATVTKPAVGRPPAPASEGAALASEAFTAYADIGASSNGLAPGDTYAALHTACMDDAGYGQYASSTPFPVRANRGMGFPQPFGPWGYIGLSLAEQYGFNPPETDGPDEYNGQPSSPGSISAGAQAAAGKCFNIVQAFNNAQFATATAIIETLNNDISNDVINDPDLTRAQQAWSACMARNGYDSVQPDSISQQYLPSFAVPSGPGSGGTTPVAPPTPTAAQNEAQVAAAVTDANCTLSTDLGGIYFAIQASYEQQFVTANQQALEASVREYKANYAKELSKLPALLRTASVTPSLPGPRQPGAPARPRNSSTPTPTGS
jgi:hypothetical protein